MTDQLLKVNDLRKSFGGLVAVDGVSFEIEKQTIVGLIGPNGAGKTTAFNLLSGFHDCDTGEIVFRNKPITDLPPYKRAKMGLIRTFQHTRELTGLKVIDNMLLAHPDETGEGVVEQITKYNKIRAVEERKHEEAEKWLKILDLWRLRDEYAGNLSVGQQKLLELGRGLMSDPALLLLDEPLAGVNPVLTKKLLRTILDLEERGKTVIIIEHELPSLMEISDEIIAMHNGSILKVGTPDEVRQDEMLLESFLGGEV